MPGVIIAAFDREFDVLAGIFDCRHKVNREQRDQAQVGGVQGARQACLPGIIRYFKGAGNTAHVTDIRLHHVDGAAIDHLLPDNHVIVLFAAGDVDIERRGNLASPVEFPVGAGLFVVADAIILQHMSDLDRLFRGIAAVGVDHQGDLVAQRRAHGLYDLLGAPRPLVDIMPALGRDAKLE